MSRYLLAVLLLLPSLVGCTVPIEANLSTPTPATWIGGTVRLDDGSDEAGGPAILFRFDCAAPPPPLGSGTPLDFVVVPEDHFDAGSAPFVFPLVPAGSCSLLGGFVDRDRDFHYAYSVAAQASRGDLGIGASIVQVGTVEPGSDWVEPVQGLLLRADTEVPLERPAFVPRAIPSGVVESPALLLDEAGLSQADALFLLGSTDIESDLVDVSAPVFTVVFAPDGDGDGVADDLNGDGLPDVVWPKVVIRRLDPEDPQGLSLSDPPIQLAAVVLSVNPANPAAPETDLIGQALALGIPFDGESVLPATSLAVVVPGLVVTSLEPLELSPIGDVAASGSEVLGSYQLLVMNSTGQTWSLPNELSQYGDDDQGLSLRVETAGSAKRRVLLQGRSTRR
jgi:hypothetical protein